MALLPPTVQAPPPHLLPLRGRGLWTWLRRTLAGTGLQPSGASPLQNKMCRLCSISVRAGGRLVPHHQGSLSTRKLTDIKDKR